MLTGQARRNSGRHASFTSSEIESLAGLPETNLVTVIQRSTVANNYEESLVDALCNDELREYFEKNPERLQEIRELHSTGFDVALSSPAFRKSKTMEIGQPGLEKRLSFDKVGLCEDKHQKKSPKLGFSNRIRRMSVGIGLTVEQPKQPKKRDNVRVRKPAGNTSFEANTDLDDSAYGSYVRHSVIVNNEKIFLPSYNYHCTCEVTDASESFATAF